MKKTTLIIIFLLSTGFYYLDAQQDGSFEVTAQAVLSRVDAIMKYNEGEIEGGLKHIYSDGRSFEINFKGAIGRNDFLFTFSTAARGRNLKILYNLGGEDVWVYNIHSLQVFHKMGIDKYDSLLSTNFSYIDFSTASFQSNYNARIVGKTLIKGIECYRLALMPIFNEGMYGELTLYATVDKNIPLRIDYHDRNRVVYKFLSLVRTMEKDGKIVPLRYDMLSIKDGTVTILNFNKFERGVTHKPEIFRPEKLGE